MGVGVGVGAGAWVCRDVGGGEDFCVLLEVVVGSELADELLPGRVEVSCGTVTVGSWERRVPASNARKDTRTTAPSTMPSASGTLLPPLRPGGRGTYWC